MMEGEFQKIGFERLDELGFTSDYARINAHKRTIKPVWDADHLLERGFYPRGTKVRFLNRNGYDMERKLAAEKLDIEKVYTVVSCNIGDWSSKYQFEEVEGSFNTVMFEKV